MSRKVFIFKVFFWVACIGLVVMGLSNCNSGNNDDAQANKVEAPAESSVPVVAEVAPTPIQIEFGKLWPFPDETMIQYTYSPDSRSEIIINGTATGDNASGLSWETEFELKGNKTLIIQVMDTGNSAFHSDETSAGSGNGKMLKVFIAKVPSGPDVVLICNDSMKRSSDPEFIMRGGSGVGEYAYSLQAVQGDRIYKIGFCFYNATLNGFKIKARFDK